MHFRIFPHWKADRLIGTRSSLGSRKLMSILTKRRLRSQRPAKSQQLRNRKPVKNSDNNNILHCINNEAKRD